MQEIKVTIDWIEKNYSATAVLNGVIIVTSDKSNQIENEFKEAFKFHIEGSLSDGDDVLPYDQYTFDFEYTFSAVLHKASELLSSKTIAYYSEINAKQIGHYIQGKKIPRKESREKILVGLSKVKEELGRHV